VATLSVSAGPAVIVEFAVSVTVTAEVTDAVVAAANRLAGRVDRSSLTHRGLDDWCFDDRGFNHRSLDNRRIDDSDWVAGIIPTVRPVAPTAVNESAIESVAPVLVPFGAIVVMRGRVVMGGRTTATLISALVATLREGLRTSNQGQGDSDSSDEVDFA
jgi:hypothetical protein